MPNWITDYVNRVYVLSMFDGGRGIDYEKMDGYRRWYIGCVSGDVREYVKAKMAKRKT